MQSFDSLLPLCDVCAEEVGGKGALAEIALVSFLLIEGADELASLIGLAETLRVLHTS